MPSAWTASPSGSGSDVGMRGIVGDTVVGGGNARGPTGRILMETGRGAAWLARLTGGQKVGSSNLPGPTASFEARMAPSTRGFVPAWAGEASLRVAVEAQACSHVLEGSTVKRAHRSSRFPRGRGPR